MNANLGKYIRMDIFEKIGFAIAVCLKKIIDHTLIQKEEHASSFKLLTSIERYKQFLIQYPEVEKRVKQYQLASYLGITPVSLSRIRSKLALNK